MKGAYLAGEIVVNLPRATTRQQWRAFSRAYRAAWRELKPKAEKAFRDMVLYGRAEMVLP